MLKPKPRPQPSQFSSTIYPLVGVIIGSTSDWETLETASTTLSQLGIPHEVRVVSAHRTPDLLFEYASTAEKRGLEVIIAGAGGAAHLPGMTASKTVLPVLGVPVESKALKGLDSLLSIAQMPGGIPVGTLAVGKSGAINAALLAAAILGIKHPAIRESLREFREAQTSRVLATPDPSIASRSQKRKKNHTRRAAKPRKSS
jgi:5-(carboxyamino)imidazole ribonucleotide mutase